MRYIFMGDALGGKPVGPVRATDGAGKPDYDEIRSRDFFKTGIDELTAHWPRATTVALIVRRRA